MCIRDSAKDTVSKVREAGKGLHAQVRTRVVGEQLQLGPRFSVNSQLRHFSPRDPGEPLDGVGQYLYPSRPGAQL